MNSSTHIETQNPASPRKMLLAMVGIGVISALLIVSTYEWTLPRVQRLKAEALEKAIFEVLPGTQRIEAYEISHGEMVDKGEGGTAVYAGYGSGGELLGYAVEAAGQGYADVIRILYGYDPQKQVLIGFQVLESKETPGLGDKIQKEAHFLANFEALDVGLTPEGRLVHTVITVKQGEKANPWEIDGITGATISSRAIGDIIGGSTEEVVPVLYGHYEKTQRNE